MKKYPEDVIVDEFVIPVKQSIVSSALKGLGYEPSPENIQLVLENDVLTKTCFVIESSLEDFITVVLRESIIFEEVKGLQKLIKGH